jgi:hypothetical protein
MIHEKEHQSAGEKWREMMVERDMGAAEVNDRLKNSALDIVPIHAQETSGPLLAEGTNPTVL